MARQFYAGANVNSSTGTFATWLERTNQIVYDMSDVVVTVADVTTANDSNGSQTTGNAHVQGYFSANVLIATEYLRGGKNSEFANSDTLYISSNTEVGNSGSEDTLTVWGDATFQQNVVIGSATSDRLSVIAYVNTAIIPEQNDTRNLGTASLEWGTLYVDDILATGNVALRLDSTGSKGYVTVGAGDDLEIHHDGTNTYIDNQTGELYIQASGITLRNSSNTETYVTADVNGAVSLYYDNATKLATKTDGVDITGELQSDSLDVDGVADISGITTLHANTALDDNARLLIGTGADLQIYHDGSHSYVTDAGTGNLKIAASQIDFLGGSDGAETMASMVDNGAVTLYYDNSAKLATTSTGIDITGSMTLDGVTIDGVTNLNANTAISDNSRLLIGTGSDLQVYHDGSHSYITDAGTGNLKIAASQIDFLGGADGAETMATMVDNGAVTLYFDNSTRLATSGDGVDVTGRLDVSSSLVVAGNTEIQSNLDVTGDLNVSGTFTLPSDTNLTVNTAIAQTSQVVQLLQIDGDTDIGSTGTDTVTITAAVDSTILPSANNTYNIGSTLKRWNQVHAASFFGALTGNVTGNVTGNADTATNSTTFTVTNNTTEASTLYPVFVDGTSSSQEAEVASTKLTFNPSTGTLSATVFSGSGASITSINASNISSGTLSTSRLSASDVLTLIKSVDGSGSGLDADLLDGVSSASFVRSDTADTIGGNLTWSDSVKALFGTSADLEIYHDGTNSHIVDSGTGNLKIASSQIDLLGADGLETMATFVDDGAVTLYYDNAAKIATASGGVTITGTATATTFSGSGSGLTGLNASNISTGTLALARLSGTYAIDISGNAATATSATSATSATLAANSTLLNGIASSDYSRLSVTSARSANLTFTDNSQAIFGTGSDLTINHDGSNSYIIDQGTGSLIVQGTSINIKNAAGTANVAVFATTAELYHSNAVKLVTSATGVTITGVATATSFTGSGAGLTSIPGGQITGTMSADTTGLAATATALATARTIGGVSFNGTANINLPGVNTTGNQDTSGNAATVTNGLYTNSNQTITGIKTFSANTSFSDNVRTFYGGGNDLEIYSDGTNGILFAPTQMTIYTGSFGVSNAAASETMITAVQNGAVTLYYDNSAKLATSSGGVTVTGRVTANTGVATISTLTDGATITPNFTTAQNFTVTLGGNRTLANPSNIVAGMTGSIFITQDGTGSRTLSFGTYWKFNNQTVPTLSTTGGYIDRLDFIVKSTTEIHAVLSTNIG